MSDDDQGWADRRIDAIAADRGFLLPHYGLLGLVSPALLDGIDDAYRQLMLTPHRLNRHARQFVLLTEIAALDLGTPAHHVGYFKEAGGTDAEVEAALRLAALAVGSNRFGFGGEAWGNRLGGYDRGRAYRTAVERMAEGVAPWLAELALGAAQTCLQHWWQVEEHIRAAYRLGVDERKLGEALSLSIWPSNVSFLVKTCQIWRGLIAKGEVAASAPFRRWAADARQGGY